MRRTAAITLVFALATAACGGAAGPTATLGGPTGAPGQPTATPPVGGPTAAPPVGGTTASVTITGGATPGTFTGSADPGCAVGFMGDGVWSANYSILEGSTAGTLSEVALVYDPSNGGMNLSVGIGPIFDTANGFTEYEVLSHYAGHNDIGTGTVQLNDAGATAVLHATGTTPDGVALDVTVNCPSITRG